MSSLTAELFDVPTGRTRLLVLPREHGAWGILMVPLVTGTWIGYGHGNGVLPLVLFMVAALALFCLRTPLESWIESSPLRPATSRERQAVLYSVIAYASIASIVLAALVWMERAFGLLALGAAVGAIFLVQAVLNKFGRKTRLAAQLVGSLGLTSTAAGAYYVVTGRVDLRALALWLANWLFAANQIHFVRLRLRAARAQSSREKFACGRSFLNAQLLAGLALFLAWRYVALPGMAIAAFTPVAARAALWFAGPPAPLEIHRLGRSELAHALLFGVLFILAYRFYGN